MGDTRDDMDIEIEQKDNKISFLENKIGVTDDKVIEEMKRLDLDKITDKEKIIGLWIDQIKRLININTLKIEKNKIIIFK